MNPVSVVVLSRFPEIFSGFKESVDRDAQRIHKIVGWDKEENHYGPEDNAWSWYPQTHPFKIAHEANTGWTFAERNDVIYAGDDTRIIEPKTIERLRECAEAWKSTGIIAPAFEGDKRHDGSWDSVNFVPFVFVYIKREVIDQVGYLDERFEGYGWEDIDYCVRVRKAGFRIRRANHIFIRHGVDGQAFQSTFRKVKTQDQINKEMDENQKRFADKWGIENDNTKIWQWIEAIK